MATFEVVEGMPGQGKSIYTARKTQQLLKRNAKWFESQMKLYNTQMESWALAASRVSEERRGAFFEKYPMPEKPERRKIAANMKYSKEFEDKWEGWIIYWISLQELTKLRNVDIVWDEIATHLDARNWPNLSIDVMMMLSQYRKRGLDIYANTQDFSMVDQRARIMITGVKSLTKIIGSRDPSPTKPPIKRIWGLVLIRQVLNWKETNPEKKQYGMTGFSFLLIEKELTDIYDTTQDIVIGELPALRHSTRRCEFFGQVGHENCTFVRVTHT